MLRMSATLLNEYGMVWYGMNAAKRLCIKGRYRRYRNFVSSFRRITGARL